MFGKNFLSCTMTSIALCWMVSNAQAQDPHRILELESLRAGLPFPAETASDGVLLRRGTAFPTFEDVEIQRMQIPMTKPYVGQPTEWYLSAPRDSARAFQRLDRAYRRSLGLSD